ncbi:outer membrane protein assembly factor BamB family protein [Aureliella helgolandensis]|uniref:Pyrrolo-quinoline quinone repeat domain-containing protein n=1 Tax=Aureliella helgolandensis TaxID=2527968 RepID=A0A518GAR1_9BACT|nr:PQQ-binding-like beta-propeller repeat protein [Aureliella helgolandensis]QDV25696.1 hypothetical protein Q31a_40230 [Aureliella helgolandensis]
MTWSCFAMRSPRNNPLATLLLLAIVGQPSGATRGADWMQLRGPNSTGVVQDATFPEHWSETENIVWKQPIAGRGWSSPIVAGDRVFITTVVRQQGEDEAAKPGLYFGGNREETEDVVLDWQLLCFRLGDGELLWTEVLHSGKPPTPRHVKNSYASETPVSDGQHVYVLFGDVGLYSVDFQGNVVWTKELPPCKTRYDWGTAASPVLFEDRLYFVSDNEDASYLAAIDTATGDEVWRTDRDEKSNWSTPYIWQNSQRTEIITPGTGRSRAYDLAGELLYEWGGASSITIATPYAAHGLLYVTSGYVGDKKRPIYALRPGASGDVSLEDDAVSNEHIAWFKPQAAPYNPSTIVYEDQLYVLYDRGLFASYHARTGALVYDQQRIRNGRSFTASPWAANGKLYCLNEFGETFVIKTGSEYELLHVNQLESKQLAMATPAIVGSRLILRTGDALYCIGEK